MRGEEPIPGLSDLAAASPSVAAEWHPEKNGGLAPERVRAGSGRVVWWPPPSSDSKLTRNGPGPSSSRAPMPPGHPLKRLV